jgi:hypothetical protein
MKHEKHPWFIRDSNPVPLGQKSGALTTELTGHLPFIGAELVSRQISAKFLLKSCSLFIKSPKRLK